MDRALEVRRKRHEESQAARLRWEVYQESKTAVDKSKANKDGTVPKPRVGLPTPEQESRFEAREALRDNFDSPAAKEIRVRLERKIGATLDFVDLPPNQQALKAGRPVVRIVMLAKPGMVTQGFASGFLVSPNLILTNFHVFGKPQDAEGTGAQFLYERTQAGLRDGLVFEFDPDTFFVSDKKLDFAMVAIKRKSRQGTGLEEFKYLPIIEAKGKVMKGDPVNIIQHPDGGPKQYATINNRLLDIRDDGFLLYETDTQEGSSGSPVFNSHWETIALHHAGVPQMEGGKLVTVDGRRLDPRVDVDDEDLIWVGNEGIRSSAIVAALRKVRMATAAQQKLLVDFLESTADPLCLTSEISPTPVFPPTMTQTGNPAMAQNYFQFSGPVTIQFGAGGASEAPKLVAVVSPVVPLQPPEEVPEKSLKFDSDYANRGTKGYKPNFLSGWNVPLPKVQESKHHGKILKEGSKQMVMNYYHYSLAMNVDRRLCAWTAVNVDYSEAARRLTKSRKAYGSDSWRLDPRVALKAPGVQLDNGDFYAPAKKIDRGHIVRRDDACWGATEAEAEFGNSDTFHWTNCTPQHQAFNKSSLEGIWGQFEEHIATEIEANGGRMSLFAGPVLNADDPEHGYADAATIQVPMEFWKVIVTTTKERGRIVKLAYGLVFDQSEPIRKFGYERVNIDQFEVNQVLISDITEKTGVVFDSSVHAADVLNDGAGGAPESLRRRLESVGSLRLRK